MLYFFCIDVYPIIMNELNNKRKEGRDYYFDSLKFYLISVVVLGHVLLEQNGFNGVLLYWIYSFHMPLFVYISGYFTTCNTKDKFLKFIIRTFETFLIFHVICLLFNYFSGKPITWNLIISPYGVYWYLFNLIIWRTVIQLLPQTFLNHTKLVIFLSLLLGVCAGFVPIDKELSFQRVFAFLPFFILGFYSRRHGWIGYVRQGKLYPYLLFVVSSVIFLLMYFCNAFSSPLLLENTSYENLTQVFVRLLIWIIAFGFSVFFLKVARVSTIAAKLGPSILYIYVYHQFVVEFLLLIGKKCMLPMNFFTAMIMTCVVLIICVFISRMRFCRTIINPISYVLHY